MTCYMCNKEVAIDAPLNVNDLIARENEDMVNNAPSPIIGRQIPQPITQTEPAQTMSMDEFWKKIKGR